VRTLAIETATAACSVALTEDGRIIDSAHEIVVRGHAERLLPMIAALKDGGRADRIVVDIGPGSFTGIRVGVAAARALGFGWGIPVGGFHSLALIAAMDDSDDERLIAIDGGHGEFFVARYMGLPIIEVSPPRSVSLDTALREPGGRIIGNAAARLAEGRDNLVAQDRAPDACGTIRLPAALTQSAPIPFYGREADAKPMIR
jgi:tRNA threonylcarbamoyl adenosine modification protein YeaZ